MAIKPRRDIERVYPRARFVAKLRRLADTIERGARFSIQIAGERITVPADATCGVEHERSSDDEEIEFQIKWRTSNAAPAPDPHLPPTPRTVARDGQTPRGSRPPRRHT